MQHTDLKMSSLSVYLSVQMFPSIQMSTTEGNIYMVHEMQFVRQV